MRTWECPTVGRNNGISVIGNLVEVNKVEIMPKQLYNKRLIILF